MSENQNDIKNLESRVGKSDLKDLETKSKSSLVKAINSAREELKDDLDKVIADVSKNTGEISAIEDRIGDKGKDQLETQQKGSLVDAINFLNSQTTTHSSKLTELEQISLSNKALAEANQASIKAMLDTGIGGSVLEQLVTEDNASLVNAINENHKEVDAVRAIATAAETSANNANIKASANEAAVKDVSDRVGNVPLSFLHTPDKTSLVTGVNQVYATAENAKNVAYQNAATLGNTAFSSLGATVTEALMNIGESSEMLGVSSGVFYPCFSADMAGSGNHDGQTIIKLNNPKDLREVILKQAQCDKWANSEQDIGYAETSGGECFLVTSTGEAAAECRGAVVIADDFNQ